MASTRELVPDAISGNNGGWSGSPSDVDDPLGLHDDATTQISVSGVNASSKGISFTTSNMVNAVSVSRITLHYRIRGGNGTQQFAVTMTIGGTNYADATRIPGTAWTGYSLSRTADSGGNPFTKDGLDGATVSVSVEDPSLGNQSAFCTQVIIVVEYVPVPATIGAARDVGSRVVRMFRRLTAPITYRGPLLLADVDLLDTFFLSHQDGPAPSADGWMEKPHQRAPFRPMSVSLDLDSLEVSGRALPLRDFPVRWWDTMVSHEPYGGAIAAGTARLDAGVGRIFARTSKALMEDGATAARGAMRVIEVVENLERLASFRPRVAADSPALAFGGLQIEQQSTNRIIQSAFKNGSGTTFTGWTFSGSGTVTEETVDLIFASSLTARAPRMTASGTISTDFQGQATATASVGANTVGCLSVYHRDVSGHALHVALQRGVDSRWWRASDRTWQVAKTWNALTVRSAVAGRDYLSRIDVGTSATTLTALVGAPASGGVGGQVNIPYHVQWEDVPYPTSAIHTEAAAATRTADKLKIENFHGRRVWGVDSGVVDHGTAMVILLPDWDSADLPAAAVRYLYVAYFDASNYDALFYSQAAGGFVFRRRLAGVNSDAVKTATVTRGVPVEVAGVWVGAAGELGRTPYSIGCVVNGVRGTDATPGGIPGAGVMPSYGYVYVGQFQDETSQVDGLLQHGLITDWVLEDGEIGDHP